MDLISTNNANKMINTPKFNPKEGHRIVSAGRVRVRVSAGKQESSVSISCFTHSNDSPYRCNHHCNIYKVAVLKEKRKRLARKFGNG